MNEKFLNLIFFLIDELQKDERIIIKSYLKNGIDLEAQKKNLLDRLREEKLKLRREKQINFIDFLTNELNLKSSEEISEQDLKLDKFAIAFRRNNKQKDYELTELDKIKLKAIEKFSKENVEE